MAEEKKYYQFPAGIYRMEIVGQALTTSKAKEDGTPGNPYVAIKAKVLEAKKDKTGRVPNIPQNEIGSSRIINLYLTEKTLEQSKLFLVAAGFNGKSLAQIDPSHPQFVDLTGFQFDALNKLEEYNGKTRDKFSAFAPRNSNAWMDKLTTAPSAAIMKLDALWGSVKVGSPAVVTKPAEKAKTADEGPEQPAWEPTDDEAGW